MPAAALRGRSLVVAMCLAEVAALLPMSAFPALLPVFLRDWGLSDTEAGWIGGIFYFGYMLTVPLLTGLTDRIDARKVFVAGLGVTALTTLGFALFAAGPWSALFWRILGGIGMAATYMPGLKALTDRVEGGNQSRSITFYTATFSVGAGLSFLAAGMIGEAFGWRIAFAAVALGPLAAMLAALRFLRPLAPAGGGGRLPDLRPVLRNRPAMAYVIAYAGHGFELVAFRSWLVAFLAFAVATRPVPDWAAPSLPAIATAVALIGLPASVLGNELALRFGRRRAVIWMSGISVIVACVIGFGTALPFGLLLGLLLVYGMLVTADSGAITAGAVAAAPAEQRGATMAVHSTLGFGFSFLGPLAVGIGLDLGGGSGSLEGWRVGFLTMAAGAALTPAAMLWIGRRSAGSGGA